MAKKTFGEIQPWNGTSGTGAEAREVVKDNFDLVNEAIDDLILPAGEIDQKINARIVSVEGDSITLVLSQDAITKLLFTKVNKDAVKQVSGTSTTDLMSQDAITKLVDSLNEALSSLDQDVSTAINNLLLNKISTSAIKQVVGSSVEDLMSQRAISDLIAAINQGKVAITSIKQVAGTSESDLMSQKAITAMNGMCNLTTEFPLGSGNYNLTTAIAAVPVVRRKPGLLIKFFSGTTWLTYQFNGTQLSEWSAEELWASLNVKNETGASLSDWMSQNAVSYYLGLKFDKSSLESVRSQSTTKAPVSKLLDDTARSLELKDLVVNHRLINNNLLTENDLLTYNSLLGISSFEVIGNTLLFTSLRITYVRRFEIEGVDSLRVIINFNDLTSGGIAQQNAVIDTAWVDGSILNCEKTGTDYTIRFKYQTSLYTSSFNLQANVFSCPPINPEFLKTIAYNIEPRLNGFKSIGQMIGTVSPNPIQVGNMIFLNKNNKAKTVEDYHLVGGRVISNRKLLSFSSMSLIYQGLLGVPDFIKENVLYFHGTKTVIRKDLSTLVETTVTFSQLYAILFLVEIYDGEFLIVEKTYRDPASPDLPSANDILGGIWRTNGGIDGTITKVHTFKNRYISPVPYWSITVGGPLILFSEYGNSTVTQQDENGLVGFKGKATAVYSSTNNGVTFTKIFDMQESPLFPQPYDGYGHVHAVHYDSFNKRTYITTGDGSVKSPSNKQLVYSDNSGVRWESVELSKYFTNGTTPYDGIQLLQMYTDSNIFLAFSDCWRQGVYRAVQFSKYEKPILEHAYALPVQDDITHFSNQFYRANPSQPILICTAAGDSVSHADERSILMLATWDGITFTEVLNTANSGQFKFFVKHIESNDYYLVLSKTTYFNDVSVYRFTMPQYI